MGVQTNWDFERVTGGAGAIAAVFLGLDHATIIDQVHLHANGAMANEDMIIEIDSATNAAYDAHLDAFSTNGITDYVWIPDETISLDADDELDINCTNTNNVTWGLTLAFRHNA